MKRLWLILYFLMQPLAQAEIKPLAEKGLIDLSSWSGHEPVRLDGEWRFFPGALLNPAEAFAALENSPAKPTYLRPGQRFTDTRLGTYVLRIKLSRIRNDVWIGGMGVYTSARLYLFEGAPTADAKPIQELGRVSDNPGEQEVFTGRSAPLRWERKTTEDLYLVVQVADFRHYWSGLWQPPSMTSEVEAFAPDPAYFSCLLAGLLLFAFAQNLSLAIGRKPDAAGLDMTVITGLMALRGLFQAAYAMLSYHDHAFLQKTYEWQLDILYITLILSSAYFCSFVQTCFPGKLRLPEKPMFLAALILCVGLVALPWKSTEGWLLAVDAFIFFTGFASTLVVARAVQQKQDESIISLVGILVLFAGGVSALGWALGDTAQAQYGIEIGLVIFIYCETQVVSRRFVRTLHLLEKITRSLDAKDKVRTQLLQTTSHDLRAPLNGMLGFLDLLLREHYGAISESVRTQITKTQKLAETLRSQVDNVLGLAEIDSKETRHQTPLEYMQLHSAQPQRLQKVRRAYSQTFHLLAIDDDIDNAELLTQVLAMDGYRVTVAHGGREGIERLEALHPDLVLLDLGMPDVSGEDVIKHMKSKENLRSIPIMLCTARATERDRMLGLQLGADDYLVKPLAMDELRLRVRNLLDRLESNRVLADQEYKDKMTQMGELLADLSHEMKNIYQGVDNVELNPTERIRAITALLPLPAAQRQLLGEKLPSRMMDGHFHEREAWLTAPDRHHPCYRDLRYLRFMVALLPVTEAEARALWVEIAALTNADLATLSQCLHLLANHLQLVDVALRSRELIDAILGFNRLESENQTFKLSTTIERTLNLVQMRMRKSSIEIICDLDASEAQGSSSAVQQILLNLISNAIDSLSAPGVTARWIRVEARTVAGVPTIRVSNSGPIIRAEHRQQLFERGFTTKGKRGSGIGLFVSRRLARRMNGELSLTDDGAHTCFILELPAPRMANLAQAS